VRGWGSPNSDDWRKSLALCLLCDFDLEFIKGINSMYLAASPKLSSANLPTEFVLD
jgi:hypothetical protein